MHFLHKLKCQDEENYPGYLQFTFHLNHIWTFSCPGCCTPFMSGSQGTEPPQQQNPHHIFGPPLGKRGDYNKQDFNQRVSFLSAELLMEGTLPRKAASNQSFLLATCCFANPSHSNKTSTNNYLFLLMWVLKLPHLFHYAPHPHPPSHIPPLHHPAPLGFCIFYSQGNKVMPASP